MRVHVYSYTFRSPCVAFTFVWRRDSLTCRPEKKNPPVYSRVTGRTVRDVRLEGRRIRDPSCTEIDCEVFSRKLIKFVELCLRCLSFPDTLIAALFSVRVQLPI